ncbi:MAG: histidine phosphatase family protein [Acidimicrobiaceae bacterium]|nr:histidine phosphatase family protein [Acidimicrobiaceae bacterium]MYD07492.1 histidine phosphatase family protein [Acidimicrobiaceae bacterium]MYI58227.1 histidine phosphatase family protein [Acidimicrobiaceae bacterium]
MLILARHGRTASNAESRLQGDSDIPLDEVGELQAKNAGAYIRDRWDIDTIFTTSLQRSQQTAVLAGFSPDILEVDDRWREISFGEFEGQKVEEVAPDLGTRWRADINYRPKGGESLPSLHTRVTEACAEMTERAADENILVVTHATPIKSAVIWATGGDPAMILKLWVYPGSISVLDNWGGSAVLLEFNRHIHT